MRHAIGDIGGLVFAATRTCLGMPPRYILVLSHIRSGSTLLHHLLQTNPMVVGAGETRHGYASATDLRKLSLRAHVACGSLFKWRKYAAAQINHTYLMDSASLLLRADVETVFLIREPRGAMGSMTRVFPNHYHSTLPQAVDYYMERTSSLCRLMAELGQAMPKRAFGLTYNELTEDPARTLTALQRHLQLREAFRSTYVAYPYTGKRGDPSERIKSGTVLAPEFHEELQLDADLEHDLRQRFESALAAMRHHCSTSAARGPE